MSTLLVAITVNDGTGSADLETKHRFVMERLPVAGVSQWFENHLLEIDSWWVAEDERYDRSDCDSAVFVKPGMQAEATALLRQHGLAY